MKVLLLIPMLLLVACGKKSDSPDSSSTKYDKPVFSQWVDDGGVTLPLEGLSYGSKSYVLDLNQFDSCNVVIDAEGTESSGTITFVSSSYIQRDPTRMTTACSDLLGSYDYYRDGQNLVYGRRGSRPIEYH